jgi:hypothetical protein
MNDRTETQLRAKLQWEAASEKLGNLLVPPLDGLPEATPEGLLESFDRLHAKLDALRAAYDVPAQDASAN